MDGQPEPIACTLGADGAADRTQEWGRFVAARVRRVERTDSAERSGARLLLADDDDALLAAVDLARREQACCAFLSFTVHPRPDGVELEVVAPPEAAEVLDALSFTAGAAAGPRRASG